MVKLRGPALSLSASGTIGNAITVSNWKGRHYLKKRSMPTDPHTGEQQARRAIMTFLSALWEPLADLIKQTWQTEATALGLTPYNFFLSYNLQRFNRLAGPSIAYPALESGPNGTIPGFSPFVNNKINAIETLCMFAPQDLTLGYTLHITPPPTCNADLSDLYYIGFAYELPNLNERLTTLANGVYRVRFRLFTSDGLMGVPSGEESGTSLPA